MRGHERPNQAAAVGKRSRVLVGRASELTELNRGLDRQGAGKPWFVQIVGKPGIGKSRLLLELARRAAARRYQVGRDRTILRHILTDLLMDHHKRALGGYAVTVGSCAW